MLSHHLQAVLLSFEILFSRVRTFYKVMCIMITEWIDLQIDLLAANTGEYWGAFGVFDTIVEGFLSVHSSFDYEMPRIMVYWPSGLAGLVGTAFTPPN